jgi:hypothetical protein
MEEPQALIYLAFEPLMPNPTANSGLKKLDLLCQNEN